MSSALQGIVAFVEHQGRPAASEELARLLQILQDFGWSGYIPADEALQTIIDSHELEAYIFKQATLSPEFAAAYKHAEQAAEIERLQLLLADHEARS